MCRRSTCKSFDKTCVFGRNYLLMLESDEVLEKELSYLTIVLL